MSAKYRCAVSGCGKAAPESGGYCLRHVDPLTRPVCPDCGEPRSMKSSQCNDCGATTRGRRRRSRASHSPEYIMKEYATPSSRWAIMSEEKRAWQAYLARDLVALGLLTEEQSRQTFPDAWRVKLEVPNA